MGSIVVEPHIPHPVAESEAVETWLIAESRSRSAVRQASAEKLSRLREVKSVQNMALTDCQASGTDFAEKGRIARWLIAKCNTHFSNDP